MVQRSLHHAYGWQRYSHAIGFKNRKLTQGGVNQFPAWSPAGQWIAFVWSVSYDPPYYMYLVRPDGTDLHAITGDGEGDR
jgi:Tol biopolymer transport system component